MLIKQFKECHKANTNLYFKPVLDLDYFSAVQVKQNHRIRNKLNETDFKNKNEDVILIVWLSLWRGQNQL